MKKLIKLISALLVGVMVISMAACESKDPQTTTNSSNTTSEETAIGDTGEASGETKTIYLYQNKIEIDDALKKTVEAYKATHPGIDFVVESASDNYATSLKTKFTGGEAPDIFTITGNEDAKLWSSHLEDLSDQPWAGDMIDLAKEGIIIDNAVYGMPVSVEGYGYMYNKELFKKAGITELPKTMTAFKDTISKLGAAGVPALLETYMDWYQPGNFMVNVGIARQADPLAFISGLNDGTQSFVGNKEFDDLANFLLYDVSKCESPFNTDFNTQMSTFVNQDIAITLGGNWNQPTLDAAPSPVSAGLMAFPINDDEKANDMLFAGVTGYWGVNKDSKVKTEVKDFITWLITTEEGQGYMTKDLKLIPAFTTFSADKNAIGELGADLSSYIKEGKVYGMYNSYYPDGCGQKFGEAVQKLVAGKSSVKEFTQELQDSWDNLKTE